MSSMFQQPIRTIHTESARLLVNNGQIRQAGGRREVYRGVLHLPGHSCVLTVVR